MADMDAPDLSGEVAALAQRMTRVEQGLQKAIQDFSPVAGRVNELSSAFQDANTRLARAETAILALQQQAPPPSEERMLALEQEVNALAGRVGAMENARLRGGRLSQRLAEIEARLPGGETPDDPE